MEWKWSHHLGLLAIVVLISMGAVGLAHLSVSRAESSQGVAETLVPSGVIPNTPSSTLDTDHDGLTDEAEKSIYHTDPLQSDTDHDGLSDQEEIVRYYTNPLITDTDQDGMPDGSEVISGFSPLHKGQIPFDKNDTDADELNDALELKLGTDIGRTDSDGDGFSDSEEVRIGSNPFVGGGDRNVERHVEVDLTHQQLHYFMNNVELGTMPISSGLPSRPTPRGEFSVLRKVPVKHYVGREPGDEYSYPNVKWNLEFKRGYYLHTAYWHNQFGMRAMSHGCVNMKLDDVGILYQFLDAGDKVIVYGATPLGRVKKETPATVVTPTTTSSTVETGNQMF